MKITRKGEDKYKHGVVKSATISLTLGKWYVSINYELPEPAVKDNGLAIGIDMNTQNIATSEGDILQIPDTAKLERRKKRYQRKLTRQQKDSGRRSRTKRTIAGFSLRIANKMQDWRHQTTTAIVGTHSTVVIEDLKTKNMSKSAKGTIENPGVNVKAKSGLNRVILKTGWGEIARMLEYKADKLVKVAPRYTSQMCSKCGHTEKDNRKSQASFECLKCNYAVNADINAALNIMAVGITASGRREPCSLERSTTRQIGLFAPG